MRAAANSADAEHFAMIHSFCPGNKVFADSLPCRGDDLSQRRMGYFVVLARRTMMITQLMYLWSVIYMAFGPTLMGFDSKTQIAEQQRPLTRHAPVHLTPIVFAVPDTTLVLAHSVSTFRRHVFDSARQSLKKSSRTAASLAWWTLTAARDFTDRLENDFQTLQAELIIARLERAAAGQQGSSPVGGSYKVPSRLASSPQLHSGQSTATVDQPARKSETTRSISALALARTAHDATAYGMERCCDAVVNFVEAGHTSLATARAMVKDLVFQGTNPVVHGDRLAAIRDALKSWLTVRAKVEDGNRE